MTDELARHQHIIDATADTEANMHTQTVPLNMFEASGALVVVAPLPAVTPGDVTVELRGTTLRFWAHVRSAAPRDYLVHEWDTRVRAQRRHTSGYGVKLRRRSEVVSSRSAS